MNNGLVRTETHPSAARRYAQLPRFFRWFSDRCVLRQLDESDAVRITRAMSHPDFERCWSGMPPRSEAEVGNFVRGAQSDWMRGTRYLMAVVRKQSHDFLGWVELRAVEKGAWMLRWFIHPEFAERDLAREMLLAAADLMFSALDADKLYANCPHGHRLSECLLNDASFIELVPAGSLDALTGEPRRQSLYELGRLDWQALAGQRARETTAATPAPAWARGAMRAELALV